MEIRSDDLPTTAEIDVYVKKTYWSVSDDYRVISVEKREEGPILQIMK